MSTHPRAPSGPRNSLAESRRDRSLAVLVALLLASTAAAQQGEIDHSDDETAAPGGIRAIAAAHGPGRSGLFVADLAGRIYFHAAGAPVHERTKVDALVPRRSGIRPFGLAYGEPWLYVFDGASRQVWAIDAWGDAPERPLALGAELTRPSHLAVSPHGLLAVVEGKKLIFLQEGREPAVYDRSEFPEPAGLVFSAWDTVHVLDNARESLVTITFQRYDSGELRFLSETESLTESPGGRWEAMGVYEGVVYLALENDVFAIVESELVPVLPAGAGFERIRDLALTREGLYLKDDAELVLVPRAAPVEFVLESTPAESQAALLDLYRYLAERDFLRARRVTPRRAYERLDAFLIEEGVLLTPADRAPADIRVYEDQQKTAYQGALPQRERTMGGKGSQRPRGGATAWKRPFCELEAAFCAGAPASGVVQGREVKVPDLAIERSISRERIVLERSLGSYLDELVPSEELRDMIEPEFLRRLNPELEKLSDDELLQHDRGLVTLPVERWSVTIAVPAADYEDRESALWDIQRSHRRVSIHSRAGFVALTAKSVAVAGQDEEEEAAASAACEALRAERDRWWEHIRYPVTASSGELIRPELGSSDVRLGVLERASSVLLPHQVFSLDPGKPTWHTFSQLAELVPLPAPQSFDATTDQVALDVATFSTEAHHGTHVSALIAGRRGRCWSGLLPGSRLVLVDLDDRHRVARAVSDSINAEVLVFNVSQHFEEPLDDLHRAVLGDGRALWVVAAGNEGLDLNDVDEASVPAPARWGREGNIVTVTASDWTGNVIDDVQTPEGLVRGANRGKRYVDLVAPGKDLLSASEQRKYGPASGTSQAAPQVAAAGALLVDPLGVRLTPGDAKARLIATAAWSSTYEGKVWGGRLDFGAAVLFPERNMLRTTTDAALGRWHAIEVVGDPKIEILNAPTYYERDRDRGDIAPATIPFRRILSLRRQPDGSFRVVLREPRSDALKILLDARLGHPRGPLGGPQQFNCSKYELLDEPSGTFAPDTACTQGLSIETIDTYVQGGHYHIVWRERP